MKHDTETKTWEKKWKQVSYNINNDNKHVVILNFSEKKIIKA